MTPSLAAVVVHHRRFPDVLATLRSVVAAGIHPASTVVVDNSEDEATRRALEESSEGWLVHTMPNRGYGAAVNAGAALLTDRDVVFVLTHETLLDGAAVEAMARAITDHPTVAAAGPAVLVGDDGKVWSHGGILSPRLRLPRHVMNPPTEPGPLHEVQWLDGSCVAYGRDVLSHSPFREDFFLYIEETELHTRLRSAGWRVVTVDGASASQSTQGMPAYWGCRNMVLFQQAHGTRLSRTLTPVYFAVRTAGESIVKRRWRNALQAPRGLFAGYRAKQKVGR